MSVDRIIFDKLGRCINNVLTKTAYHRELIEELWGRLCPDMGPEEWQEYILSKSTVRNDGNESEG